MGWQGGVLLATFATALLLPRIGWRGMWALGLLPALLCFFIRKSLAEPEIFQRRAAQRQRLPLRLLVKDAATRRISAGVLILCSVQNFGYYGIMIWLPSYLANRRGYSLTQSSTWTGVTVVGMCCGIWIFGHLADRIGRRPAFFLYQTGAAISVLIYARLTHSLALLIGGAIMGMFVNGMVGGYATLMSELYPTEARATAQNVLYNMGRAVGGFGPIVVGALATRYSFVVATSLLAILYGADLIATYFLIPERRGHPLT
jgi:MFS family permease